MCGLFSLCWGIIKKRKIITDLFIDVLLMKKKSVSPLNVYFDLNARAKNNIGGTAGECSF